jgi:phage shock protein C
MSRREAVLWRDSDDAMLGGVCAGLARYFDVDTTLVRAVFVASTLISGFGLVLYVVLWALLDPAPPPPPPEPPPPPVIDETPVDTIEPPAVEATDGPGDAVPPEPTADEHQPLTLE